jgi:hypothetical protein
MERIDQYQFPRAMTSLQFKHASAISRRDLPELCMNPSAQETKGAGNAGRLMRPRPRVRNKTKHTSVVTTVTPEITRHSPRNGFTAYFVLSPATNSSCHRRQRIKG